TLVIEHVVAVTYRRDFLNDVSIIGIENQQSPRCTSNNKQPVIVLVECHRVVGKRQVGFPSRYYGVLFTINHHDLLRFWEIYIDSRAIFLKLKRFWVSIKFNVTDFVAFATDFA